MSVVEERERRTTADPESCTRFTSLDSRSPGPDSFRVLGFPQRGTRRILVLFLAACPAGVFKFCFGDIKSFKQCRCVHCLAKEALQMCMCLGSRPIPVNIV